MKRSQLADSKIQEAKELIFEEGLKKGLGRYIGKGDPGSIQKLTGIIRYRN